jgi:hypothetical protein
MKTLPTSLATDCGPLSTFVAGVDLAGTSTGVSLWVAKEVVRGACGLGGGRAPSAARAGMGGDGEVYDGMLKVMRDREDELLWDCWRK